MGNIQEFIAASLGVVVFSAICFYLGCWVVRKIKLHKKSNKSINSNALGDGLASPLEVYGSAVAPGRSSVIQANPSSGSFTSQPLDARDGEGGL